jgi:hypothetical protein
LFPCCTSLSIFHTGFFIYNIYIYFHFTIWK